MIPTATVALLLPNKLLLPPCLLLNGFGPFADHLKPVQLADVAPLDDLVNVSKQILLTPLPILFLLLSFNSLLLEIVYRLFIVPIFRRVIICTVILAKY